MYSHPGQCFQGSLPPLSRTQSLGPSLMGIAEMFHRKTPLVNRRQNRLTKKRCVGANVGLNRWLGLANPAKRRSTPGFMM